MAVGGVILTAATGGHALSVIPGLWRGQECQPAPVSGFDCNFHFSKQYQLLGGKGVIWLFCPGTVSTCQPLRGRRWAARHRLRGAKRPRRFAAGQGWAGLAGSVLRDGPADRAGIAAGLAGDNASLDIYLNSF